MDPNKCNQEIFDRGGPVVILDASTKVANRWVEAVAVKAGVPNQIDWHYSGGRAQVLFLGSHEERMRVVDAINELEPMLKQLGGRILQDVAEGGPGLFRNRVTPVPEGTIAVSPETGLMIGKG